jgi:uncharacterized protein (TIGR03435 family)
MKHRLTLLVAVGLAATLHAQAPETTGTFEVAVIRRIKETPTRSWGGRLPGSNYVVPGMTVAQLVGSAYGVPSDRVVGAPRWATRDLYEIHATAAGNPSGAETTQLLQALLRDRFKLAARTELRDYPVYELRVARADGRLGSRMQPSPIDCSDPEARQRAEALPIRSDAPPPCTIRVDAGAARIVTSSVSIDRLVPNLSGPAGRTVLDRTGLSGGYDIDLEWSPDSSAEKRSIFTAVQEQLGLTLESATAPLAVIVIDRVERPNED